jgi:D-3-phosphoglycerate dehydrogenase
MSDSKNSKPKVIFIDSVHPILFERLEKAGYICDWKNKLNREEILKILPEYSGAVIRSKFKFNEEVFEQTKKLKWIARSGAGMENIDREIANKKGVVCYNSPEGNRDAVAEHCLAMILSLFNNLKQSDLEVRNGEWNREKNRGLELKGKTIGLLGYGFMGEALAKRLQGFGVNVIAYDKYKKDFGSKLVKEVSLDQLYKETDVLSIHLPLTEETQFMVNEKFLSQFIKPIYLINTARGKNLKTRDLVRVIESGKVIGACLDVLEYETTSFEKLKAEDLPEAFKYISNSDKVILTPHVAGWTIESYFKLSDVLADKILKR